LPPPAQSDLEQAMASAWLHAAASLAGSSNLQRASAPVVDGVVALLLPLLLLVPRAVLAGDNPSTPALPPPVELAAADRACNPANAPAVNAVAMRALASLIK